MPGACQCLSATFLSLCPTWCRPAPQDWEFYQALIRALAQTCTPPAISTLFPDDDQPLKLRSTWALEAVRAVFKHLEDNERLRDFQTLTFEPLLVRP